MERRFDSHIHSENSSDGVHAVSFLAETAEKLGLGGIAITDHCECDTHREDHVDERLMQCSLDTLRVREAFRGRLEIAMGVEIGQPLFDPAAAKRFRDQYATDFVLLSVHRVQGWEDFSKTDFSGVSPSRLHHMVGDYFRDLLQSMDLVDYDSIAHLTFPARYPMQQTGAVLDFHHFDHQVEAVLKKIVTQGKALEVNTSGLRDALGEPLPGGWVLRRFRELGGELVTVGSDAHRAEDLGSGMDEAMALLRSAGFSWYTCYRDHKPVMLTVG